MVEDLSTMKMKYKDKKIKDFPYKIDPRLQRKLEKLLATLETKDIWILVDGDEGSGKTNTACYLLYWFHCMTGREFTLDRFYFDSNDMFEWVKANSYGLINWDEATLGGLSTEWYTQAQINLLKFAMVGRKKHHIFILCIPRFDKLKGDLRRDRIHAMIHMDLGRYQKDYGHYIYLTKKGIKALNRLWEKKKVRAYLKCALKTGGFGSNIDIPYVFPELLNEEEYEKKKDIAINSIGVKKKDDKVPQAQKRLEELQEKFLKFAKKKGITMEELSVEFDMHPRSIYGWKKHLKEAPPEVSEVI